MELFFLLIGGIILAVVIMVAVGLNDQKIKTESEEKLAEKKSLDEVYVFKHPTSLSSPNPYSVRRGATVVGEDRYMIGVKWDEAKFFFGNVSKPFELEFPQIVEIELVKDGDSVTKTNRGSQLAGAAVGAVALGGVGAIIGGLSGSSRNKQKIKSIDIKIETDHPEILIFKANFFKSTNNSGDKADGIIVGQSVPEAERWYSILQRAMKQADANADRNGNDPRMDGTIETRLEKLWKLKESGALTEEEYSQQKRKILSE